MRGVWFLMLAACQADVVRDHVDPPAPKPVTPPAPIVKPPIEMLASAEYGDVLQAKRQLVRDRAGSIAPLVAMVDRDERVVLENTGDTIYPGAKKFYGHGRIVNYDLDALADRAGWVLEELTFHDFGFTDGVHGEIPLDPKKDPQRLARARAAVHAWAAAHAARWNCFAALVEEMRGPKPFQTYFWLFDRPTPPCDGFTTERFRAEVLPIVKAHARDAKHPMHDYAVEFLANLDANMERFVNASLDVIVARMKATTATTTVTELEQLLGRELRDIGSGIHIYVYNVGGDEFRIGSPDGKKVMYIRHVHDGTETVLYSAS